MASSGQTVAGINVALGLQSAAFLRGINQATAATAKATQNMQKNLNQMNNAFMQTGKAVTQFANGFRSLFAVQQIAQAAKAIADYSDSWQQAGNKIAAAEQISGRQARSLSGINQIAIETRSSLDATADLYAKLLRTTADVAKSEDEVARATRVVSQGFKAGGASTLEMENGIRQLAQALGSGFLQGDELRSIRENAPLIAKALADEFQTTVGGLKALGAEGKITSDRIFKALLSSETEVGNAFARTNSTIGDSFVNVNNALTQYVGLSMRSSGATALITSGLNGIALHMDQIARGFKWTPIGIFFREIGVLIDSAKDKWQLLYDATRPKPVVELGDAYADTKENLFEFASVLDTVPGKFDLMTMKANQLTVAGNTLAKSDLFNMAGVVDFKAIDFEPFMVKTDQLNQHVKDFKKNVTLTHSGLIKEIGNFSEQWIEKLEDIKKKYPDVADEIRATADAAVKHSGDILSAIEGFGATVSPLEKFNQKQKEIELQFGNTAEGARALAGAEAQLVKDNEALAEAFGNVLSPAEELARKLRDINAAKSAGIEVGNAVEQSTLRAADQQLALREGLGLAITPMETYDAMNRKIQESVGLVATAEEKALLATNARIQAQNNLTTSMGLSVDPIAQFQATMEDLKLKQAGGIDVTQAQIGAYARLGGSVLDLAGQASGAFAQMFKDNKAFAIANAVISTAEAIAKTIGTFGATPWGLAAAAVAAAVGAAQIATIISAQPGGAKAPGVKGSGGGKKVKAVESAGASSTSAKSVSSSKAADVFKQNVTLIIEGDSFGPEHFKKMVEGLNGVIADGAVLRVGGR